MAAVTIAQFQIITPFKTCSIFIIVVWSMNISFRNFYTFNLLVYARNEVSYIQGLPQQNLLVSDSQAKNTFFANFNILSFPGGGSSPFGYFYRLPVNLK